MKFKGKNGSLWHKVSPLNELFDAYYINEIRLIRGNNQVIHLNDWKFKILNEKDILNWLCFYEKSNYKYAEDLYNNSDKASKAYEIKIREPEWIEMKNFSSALDWTYTANDFFGKGKEREFNFIIFLLGKNDKI